MGTAGSGLVVGVVVGDDALRRRLAGEIARLGCTPLAFAATADCLASVDAGAPAFLVVDQDLPDGGAGELQRRAQERNPRLPVVGVAADASAALAVRTLKAGAIDFLCAPVVAGDVAAAVAHASAVAARWRDEDAGRMRAGVLLARLTPRERAILDLVLDGRLNKQIAATLGSRESTVKVHRSRLMRKLEVRSVVELVHFGRDLRDGPPRAAFAAGGTAGARGGRAPHVPHCARCDDGDARTGAAAAA